MTEHIVTELPFVSAGLAGIGGSLKEEPEHFVVEEIPLYTPQGSGDHIYLRVRRKGWNTRDLQKSLAGLFGMPPTGVGYAGLKDKNALATQTFSLNLKDLDPEQAAEQVRAELPVEVLEAGRHANKLKTGHLLGNSFHILVSGAAPDAGEKARAIARVLAEKGVANYFGEQRFGMRGDNAAQGREILNGKGPRKKWLRKLLLSAWQSELFNAWLAARIQDGLFEKLLSGDVAKKTDTGGMFEVEDLERESARFEQGEISYTGPIYGYKMRKALDQAGERESQLLSAEGVDKEMMAKAGLKGTRRPARLMVDGLEMEETPQGMLFSFALPKGSYATALLREFMKN